MYYEVTSRHQKGFLTQTLTVQANDPDDACYAADGVWDMQNRVITRLRRVHDHEVTAAKTERQLFTWTTLMVVAVIGSFVTIIFFGPTP